MKIDKKKNAIRNALWGYISKVLSLIMPFIFRTVIIYSLGSDYLGLNSLFTSILQVLSLSELGIGTAIVYSMYGPIAKNDTNKINSLLNLYRKVYKYIGIIILTIGVLIMPFLKFLISGNYPSEINIYVVYFAFLLNTSIGYLLFGYRTSLINAFQRNDVESKINALISFILHTFSCIVIILTHNYYLYLIILLFTTIINNIWRYYITKKMFPIYKCDGKITEYEKKNIKKNVFALMCHKIGSTILNSADNIVISAMLGLTVLAQYTNYYYVINSVSALIIICFSGLTAGLGNSFATESKDKSKAYFEKVLFFNAYITIVSGVLIFSIFQEFIGIWVGESYILDYKIMILFIIYFYIHTIRRTIIVFRDAAGMWWDNKFQPIISALLNLVLNILLTRYIGLYGILISTIISMIIIDIPWEAIVFLKKKINIDPKVYLKKIMIYFGILSICCFVVQIIGNAIEILKINNEVFMLIIKFIVGFVISNFIMFIMYCKTNEYKYYKNLLWCSISKLFNKKERGI